MHLCQPEIFGNVLIIIRAHSFPQKILPGSGNSAAHHRKNFPNSVDHHYGAEMNVSQFGVKGQGYGGIKYAGNSTFGVY